jgi:hypothetical protein
MVNGIYNGRRMVGTQEQMASNLRMLALAAGLLSASLLAAPALAQQQGGILTPLWVVPFPVCVRRDFGPKAHSATDALTHEFAALIAPRRRSLSLAAN